MPALEVPQFQQISKPGSMVSPHFEHAHAGPGPAVSCVSSATWSGAGGEFFTGTASSTASSCGDRCCSAISGSSPLKRQPQARHIWESSATSCEHLGHFRILQLQPALVTAAGITRTLRTGTANVRLPCTLVSVVPRSRRNGHQNRERVGSKEIFLAVQIRVPVLLATPSSCAPWCERLSVHRRFSERSDHTHYHRQWSNVGMRRRTRLVEPDAFTRPPGTQCGGWCSATEKSAGDGAFGLFSQRCQRAAR